jgi:hypothetical protein
MKKVLWLLLAAMPMQAVANDEDPIAYKCYYCTPDEMEDVALAQGVGRHYVYDAQKLTIVGYDVDLRDGALKAESFVAEGWLQTQFLGMMSLYDPRDGEMRHFISDVALFAPILSMGGGIVTFGAKTSQPSTRITHRPESRSVATSPSTANSRSSTRPRVGEDSSSSTTR